MKTLIAMNQCFYNKIKSKCSAKERAHVFIDVGSFLYLFVLSDFEISHSYSEGFFDIFREHEYYNHQQRTKF